MEQCSTDIDALHVLSDLNDNEIENEELDGEDEPVANEDEIQATSQVEFANLTVEELERKLEVNQVVENEHVAYALYNKYARMKGFSVRRGKGYNFNGCKLLRAKIFLCSCEGIKDESRSKNKLPDYQKTSFRCKCMARLRYSRTMGGVWKVAKFVKEHTHELYAPDETYLLKSGRNMTNEQEVVLNAMRKSKIPIAKAFRLLENVSQGREHVGFTQRDAYNCVNRGKRKTKMENEDSIGLLQHFTRKANDELDFYSSIDKDDDNKLMNFFFRDRRCLIDYSKFNEVVTFDTTYRTNRYEMICAVFVGINHHNENVMFGCAFLSDETAETFEWLFKEFLASMGGKQPGMIFTDQCQAMAKAIRNIFPSSKHRLCQWHINQNAPSHFGSLNNDSHFHYLWNKCMNFCEYENDFEATWKEMRDKYNIGEQSWFNQMYDLREKWASVFSSDKFSAGLLATSRSEGTNAALKKEIGNKTSSLLECVRGYEIVQQRWRVKEKEKDILCRHNKYPVLVSHPLLEHAAGLYTFNMFKVFEKEFKDTMSLETPEKIVLAGSSLMIFKVKRHGERSWIRTVEYDIQKDEIKCSCHKLETLGILCCHAIKVLDVVKVQIIPEKCIRKRWTKAPKTETFGEMSGGTCSEVGSEHQGVNSYIYETVFVSEAAQKVRELALQGKAHNETREILKKHIESAEKEMNAWFEKMGLNSTTPCLNMHINEVHNLADCYDVRDPGVAKTKGITIRHWDDKSKKKGKGKGKAQNSKTTKGPKQKVQKRQDDVNTQFSQGTLSAPQSEIPYWSWPPAYENAPVGGTVRPQYPQFAPLNPMTRFDGHNDMVHNVRPFGFVELLQGMEGNHEHASKTT